MTKESQLLMIITPVANSTHIVVLGGGYAGILATLRLHHRTRGMAVNLTLISNETQFVHRIRLHEVAAGRKLSTIPIKQLLRGMRVHFQQGNVTQIDTAKRQIKLQTANGIASLVYDRLVYALGSSPERNNVPGVQEHTYTLDVHSAQQLAERLPTAKQVLIVGSGLTGIEAATEFAERYPQLQVELLTAGTFGADLSAKGAQYLRKTFTNLHITLHEHNIVQQVEAGKVITPNGSEVPFEICVWLTGFKVSALAKSAGLAVNERGQMLVDEHLQSVSHPEIYGAGDAATIYGLRMACATAMPMAAFAADSLAAELKQTSREAFRFGFAVRCISLGRRRGLLQWVTSDDTPHERIITGRAGAIMVFFA